MTRRPYTPPEIRSHGPVEARTRGGFDPAVMDPAVIGPAIQSNPWVFVLLLFAFFFDFGGSAGTDGGEFS